MASRHKKNAQDKQFDRIDKESPLKISRRDVAKRELVHAIQLHFDEGDPVVIHLLAFAARDVCAPIVKATGRQTFAETVEQMVKPEFLKAWRENLRVPYNFFKHGGADPDKELRYFDPVANDMLLLEVCADYRSAFDVTEKEMLVFQAWHIVTYLDILNEYGQQLLDKVSKGFEGLDAKGRLKRGREILDAIQDGIF